MRCSRLLSLLLAAALVPPAAAGAQHEHHHHATGEPLGEVHFPITCAPTQQAAFDRAVALLHSFDYERAGEAFAAIAAADPRCAMASWGVAMSNFHQVWAPPTPPELERGRAAAKKAAELAPADARERAFIAAIGAFYLEDAARTHPERVQAYAQAMDGVAAAYPDDAEAQIFDALATLSVAYSAPADKTYARQKAAAAVLQKWLARLPRHPGIAHYMIHSFDYPELAPLALDAARAYAKIAPAAPHALHMPSHIFTRLGLWPDSIASNLASAEAARAIVRAAHPGATAYEELHAMDYLAYAYLQQARDAEARALVDAVGRVTSFDVPAFSAGYALAAIPARYALERRAWKDAVAIVPRPDSYPWDKVPYAEAIVHFARAVGAARLADLGTARAEVDRLGAIVAALRAQPGFDWGSQVEIQRLAAAAWLARAEHHDAAALDLLRQAADLESTTDKHPVTPGSVLPAREQLGDLLRELGQPRQALAEYERSLTEAPARFNSVLGAALAAEAAGDPVKKRAYFATLAKLAPRDSEAGARIEAATAAARAASRR